MFPGDHNLRFPLCFYELGNLSHGQVQMVWNIILRLAVLPVKQWLDDDAHLKIWGDSSAARSFVCLHMLTRLFIDNSLTSTDSFWTSVEMRLSLPSSQLYCAKLPCWVLPCVCLCFVWEFHGEDFCSNSTTDHLNLSLAMSQQWKSQQWKKLDDSSWQSQDDWSWTPTIPARWQQTPTHYDETVLHGYSMYRTIQPTAWSRKRGLHGMDPLQVPLVALCRHGAQEFGLRPFSAGRFIGIVTTRTVAESVFCSQ